MGNFDFCVSVNPDFISEDLEKRYGGKEICEEEFHSVFDQGLEKYDIRVREELRFMGSRKMILSTPKLEDLHEFLEEVYGYMDWSSIYLWNCRSVELINHWKSLPRGDVSIWRLI